MDPKHLVQLAEVIDLGSMSRAAQRLNVTQPTLSRIIRVIEDRVGSPVLRRGRYGVTPTLVGERLAEEGRAIARRTAQAGAVIDHWKLGLTGELIVGVGPMLAATIMGDFIAQSLTRNWPYSLQLVSENAARLTASLNRDELDVAIIPYKLNVHQEQLSQELLFIDQLAVFTGVSSPLAGRDEPIEPGELTGLPWIETATRSGLFGSTREALAQIGLLHDAHRISFSGDIMMVMRVIAQTNALCVLPQRLIGKMPPRTDIVELKVQADLPRRDIALWTTNAKRDRPEILHFREELRLYLEAIGLC